MAPKHTRHALAARTCASVVRHPVLCSALAGLIVGAAIRGMPAGWAILPLTLGVWLASPSFEPPRPVGPSFATFGLFAGFATEMWVPEAAAEATGSWGFALCLFVLLAATHGSFPWAALGAVMDWTRQLRRLEPILIVLALFAVESLISVSGILVPWVLLGHSQSPDSLGWASLASVGGVPAVSAALVALALCIRQILVNRRTGRPSWRAFASLCALLAYPLVHATLGAAPSILPSEVGDDLTLLAVQPNFPREGRWIAERQPVHLDRIGKYTARAIGEAPTKPDFVLWPENVVTPAPAWRDLSADVADWSDRLETSLISGVAVPQRGRSDRLYLNTVLVRSPGSTSWSTVDKRILIPFLESARFLGVEFDGLSTWLGPEFQRSLRATPAPARADSPAVPRDAIPVAPFLCFEALFPREIADRRMESTRVLATLADDSWIPNRSATDQLTRYSAYRAIEQGLPHVRVAHGGRTMVHDAGGRVVHTLPLHEWGTIAFTVPPSGGAKNRSLAALSVSALLGLAAGFCLRCRYDRPQRIDRASVPIDYQR